MEAIVHHNFLRPPPQPTFASPLAILLTSRNPFSSNPLTISFACDGNLSYPLPPVESYSVAIISSFNFKTADSWIFSAKKCVGDWCLGRTSGSGTANKVRLAERKLTGEWTAVKVTTTSQLDSRSDLQRTIHHEVALMKFLPLLKFIDCCESPRLVLMFSCFGARGDCFHYLTTGQKLSPEVLSIFEGIVPESSLEISTQEHPPR
jgi:hypothetical protein